jgi:N-acetylglutamate synthase-like GNAT family acetyltransferase
MIRSIRPTDLPLLAALNRRGLINEAYARRDLTRSRQSLSLGVLLAHWLALEENRQTWVNVERRKIDGLISARHEGVAWEIDRLVVEPDADPRVVQRLLSYLAAVGSEVGIQRLYLRLEAASDLVALARGAGFVAFSAETLYARVTPVGGRPERWPTGVRPRLNSDAHAVFQLYCAAVPLQVRQAEAMTLGEWQQFRSRGRPALGRRELVYERDGELLGWVQADVRGRSAHLELLVHPDHADVVDLLLDVGLAQHGGRAPVYCLVADHEARLARALAERGFHPEASFCALVKQLSVRVKQPRLVPVPG